jgi:hypothetical protein
MYLRLRFLSYRPAILSRSSSSRDGKTISLSQLRQTRLLGRQTNRQLQSAQR